jgi:hypothetical protein
MSTQNNIQAELESLGATLLSAIPVTNPYRVPEGYFTRFSSGLPALLETAADSAIPELSLKPEMPFSMPAGFFEQFSGNVLNRIKAEEQAEQDDLTQGWSRTMPFQVPAGYFEQLPERLLQLVRKEQKIVVRQKAIKRVALVRSMRVAASVALIIFAGLGIMRYNMTGASTAAATAKIDFSGIPKSAITDYINQNIDDFDVDMIVNNMGGKTAKLSASGINVSRADIEAYLEDNG